MKESKVDEILTLMKKYNMENNDCMDLALLVYTCVEAVNLLCEMGLFEELTKRSEANVKRFKQKEGINNEN